MSNSPTVLIVEDDLVDVEIVKRGIRSRSLDFDLQQASDGRKALEYLRSGKLKPPQLERLLVFLDINMPGMNGHQFLDELRADPQLKRTIVFVLTTSDHVRDKAQAYDRNVAGYFVKSNISGLLDVVTPYASNVEFPPADKT